MRRLEQSVKLLQQIAGISKFYGMRKLYSLALKKDPKKRERRSERSENWRVFAKIGECLAKTGQFLLKIDKFSAKNGACFTKIGKFDW